MINELIVYCTVACNNSFMPQNLEKEFGISSGVNRKEKMGLMVGFWIFSDRGLIALHLLDNPKSLLKKQKKIFSESS